MGYNKIVAGVVNYAISPVVAKTASRLQRGFVEGRVLTQNPVDLDSESRRLSFEFYRNRDPREYWSEIQMAQLGLVNALPLIVLFDFAAAFPSVAHAWLRAVLVAIKVPTGLLNVFDGLYHTNTAFWNIDGQTRFLFHILSGVLQGCPLSGSLFVIAIDPLLFQFRRQVMDPLLGQVRACADDIGAALARLDSLPVMCRIFARFRVVSGLTLKPAKSIIVLTTIESTDSNIAVVKEWLRTFCPDWSQFQIKAAGKYLGVYLGPGSGSLQWKAPVSKFKQRVAQLSADKLPITCAAFSYASKCVSTMGYMAQLLPPPKNITRIEMNAVHALARIPPSSLTDDCIHALDKLGGVRFTRLRDYMKACNIRFAWKTLRCSIPSSQVVWGGGRFIRAPTISHGNYVPLFLEQHRRIQFAADECLPSGSEYRVSLRPPGWDADAFCSHLTNAYDVTAMGLKPATVVALQALKQKFLSGRVKKSLQSEIYRVLADGTPDPWPRTLTEKIPLLVEVPRNFSVNEPLLDPIRAALSALGSTKSMCILRTWINGWFTSTRMNEGTSLPCILGCEGARDSVSHYISCEPLWTCLIGCTCCCTPLLNRSPYQRLALSDPTALNLTLVAVAFQAYHAVKLGSRRLVDVAVASGDFSHVTLQFISEVNAIALEYPNIRNRLNFPSIVDST